MTIIMKAQGSLTSPYLSCPPLKSSKGRLSYCLSSRLLPHVPRIHRRPIHPLIKRLKHLPNQRILAPLHLLVCRDLDLVRCDDF